MSGPTSTSPDLSRRQATLALAGVLIAAAALYLLGIRWGIFQHEPTWAFDEILPTQVLHKWWREYPPAHRYLLQVVYELVDSLGLSRFESQGGIGPLLARVLGSRLLSVAMACASLVFLYRTSRRLFSRASSLAAVVSVAFGTNFVYYAKTANLDIPYVFWFSAALLLYYKARDTVRWRELALFAFCAAMATATKDQAGGLFLLPPLALVAASHRRFGGSLLTAAVRPRMLTAAAIGIGTYLLLYGEPWSGELAHHLGGLRALPYEHYRTYELTPLGLAQIAGMTLRNMTFNSGLPVVLAMLAGLALALRRPRREAALLESLLFALPYWLVFIVASGFNYDRHYLPISFVGALFAARAYEDLAGLRVGTRRLRPAIAAALLVWLALRALSVDLMLRGDARYAAQEWLRNQELTDRTIGLGSEYLLPEGIHHMAMDLFQPRRVGEHGFNPDVWHNCAVLGWLDAEYVIPEMPDLFTTPGLNYREHRRFRNTSPFSVVAFDRFPSYYSNVVKPARDQVLFRRTDEPCVDLDPLAAALEELGRDWDPARAEQLARSIFELPHSPSTGLGDIRLIRDQLRFATRGILPLGVAVRNRGIAARQTEMWIEVAEKSRFPVTVTVENGETRQAVVFDHADVKQVQLPAVEPGGHALFVVRADRSWRDGVGRIRGARLNFRDGGSETARRREEFARHLRRIARGQDPAHRAALEQALTEERLDVGVVSLEGAKVAGVTANGRLPAGRPAAILVENPQRTPRRAVLRVAGGGNRARPPLVLRVDAGSTRHPIAGEAVSQVPLGVVDGRSSRLFVIWTEAPGADTAEPAGSVRLRAVSLRPLGRAAGTELARENGSTAGADEGLAAEGRQQ